MTTRRDFLKSSASIIGSAAAASILPRAWAVDDAAESPFRISLAEWSLNRAIFGGQLDHLDFAKVAKEDFGIEGVEYVNQFWKDKANDSDYVAQMKQRAADHGVRSLLIMIDGEGNLGDPDSGARRTAVENHFKWVEAGAELGCHSIRVNAASEGTYDEQLELAADGLLQLTLFAEQHNLNVIVENHGHLSSNGAWLSEVMRRVNHPHCGTLPDFGNFNLGDGEWYDAYQGVEELMPFAKAVSAKSYNFDDARPLCTVEGERELDYQRLMQIVYDAGYRGFVGIEYEGNELGEMEGIQKTKELIERASALIETA
jgi:sugar phosphate isomerase/epimerase